MGTKRALIKKEAKKTFKIGKITKLKSTIHLVLTKGISKVTQKRALKKGP